MLLTFIRYFEEIGYEDDREIFRANLFDENIVIEKTSIFTYSFKVAFE